MEYCIYEHTVQHLLKVRGPKLKEFNGILHLRAYSTIIFNVFIIIYLQNNYFHCFSLLLCQKLKVINEILHLWAYSTALFEYQKPKTWGIQRNGSISEHTVQHFLNVRFPIVKQFNEILNLRAYSTAFFESPIPKLKELNWILHIRAYSTQEFNYILHLRAYITALFEGPRPTP